MSRYSSRPAGQWPPLFYRILANKVRDQQRRARVRGQVSVADGGHETAARAPDPAGRQPDTDHGLERAIDALDLAISALAPRQQQALLLRLVEGLDVKQTAIAMKCSPGSVKTHYSRAVHALRDRLGDHWP